MLGRACLTALSALDALGAGCRGDGAGPREGAIGQTLTAVAGSGERTVKLELRLSRYRRPAPNVETVVFTLNGRWLKTDTAAPFGLRVPASVPGSMLARVSYTDDRAPQLLRRSFLRCPSGGPRFTG